MWQLILILGLVVFLSPFLRGWWIRCGLYLIEGGILVVEFGLLLLSGLIAAICLIILIGRFLLQLLMLLHWRLRKE